ncbi:glycine rich domain-containing protein [Clostridioides difficile]
MATVNEFNCTGSEQSVTLKPGKYKFECWGARGGATGTPYASGFYYGLGGYCSGELTLRKETILYIYVGFDGKKSMSSTPFVQSYTFNGGGYGSSRSGGGATDIRLVGGEWDNEQGLLSRIIVAGGGGGTFDTNTGGHGGGLRGYLGTSTTHSIAHGGTQYEGGRGRLEDGSCDGSFGKGASPTNVSAYSGGGGGWFGGSRANSSEYGSGGGSGYVLTKDSYKPKGYIPTSEYYFNNVVMTTGGNTFVDSTGYSDGRAKITLLQALPFLNVSSYNSTTATFKADHTDSTLLTKIEIFIDDTLKETITTDLTLEKTINYILEDNALHTLKIVVTDSTNATAECVVSISKNIMPLEDDASLQDIASKVSEIKEGLINGKTSIINVLGLKNIESSLNNSLVELSEKVKDSFDSSDASVQDLMNQLTQSNNTISQLNAKYKYASGTIDVVKNSSLMANLYGESFGRQPGTWLKIDNLGFIPNIFVAECQYVTSNNYIFKHIVIATYNIKWFWDKKDFSARIEFSKEKNSNQDFGCQGQFYSNNERDVYMNNKGINVPASSPNATSYLHSWYAIKFI